MDIEQKLTEILKDYRGEVAFDKGSTFDQMGFDSLDKVELLMKIEEEFDINFDEELKIDTVGELVEKIQSLIK